MRNSLALMGAMAIAGCSEPATQQLREPSQVGDGVDRGVDTPEEAKSLVREWQREGFKKLAGSLDLADTATVLWDPTKCADTRWDYNNGVALSRTQITSMLPGEEGQPIPAMKVDYLRKCDGRTVWRTDPLAIPVSEDHREVYNTLEDYHSAMAMAITE